LWGGLALGTTYLSVFIRVIQKILENTDNKIGLEILSVLTIYLLTENIEASAYLYWPGLVMLGIVLKDESIPKKLQHFKE
jgi:NhaP-type Na+/H+ or K+/H+ antiporter